MSKTLATIQTHAAISFDLIVAKHGNIYTKEAYTYFQRLQFKNLLRRFDVEASVNDIEKKFKEITDRTETEKIFEEACMAEVVGAAILKDDGNVPALFAHPSGYGRIALAFGEDQVYSIPRYADGYGISFAGLSKIARQAGTFVMCDLKRYLPFFSEINKERCFDAVVAAYLLKSF